MLQKKWAADAAAHFRIQTVKLFNHHFTCVAFTISNY